MSNSKPSSQPPSTLPGRISSHSSRQSPVLAENIIRSGNSLESPRQSLDPLHVLLRVGIAKPSLGQRCLARH